MTKIDIIKLMLIISEDNLRNHSFSSCFAFNVDEGVRSIIVSVKGRRRGTKNQLRPQICITATIYPVQSIVNCDLIISSKWNKIKFTSLQNIPLSIRFNHQVFYLLVWAFPFKFLFLSTKSKEIWRMCRGPNIFFAFLYKNPLKRKECVRLGVW